LSAVRGGSGWFLFFLGSLFLVVVGLVLFGLFCFALKLKDWFFLFGRGLLCFSLSFFGA